MAFFPSKYYIYLSLGDQGIKEIFRAQENAKRRKEHQRPFDDDQENAPISERTE